MHPTGQRPTVPRTEGVVRKDFLQHVPIEREVGHQLLERGVILSELLEFAPLTEA